MTVLVSGLSPVLAVDTEALEQAVEQQTSDIKLAQKELKKIQKQKRKEEKLRLKAERKAQKKAEKLAKKVAKAAAKERKRQEKEARKLAKKKAKEESVIASNAKQSSPEAIKLDEDKDMSEIDRLRAELKANEAKALDFIYPSIDTEEEALNKENFFNQNEKQQLLELWRSTLARNRTIQFIIKSLSNNPNETEENNAVMQVLSRALFVPFYAVSAVANNSLVSGGSMVGARVIGDVVNSTHNGRERGRQITKTDLIVLFMMVDEVAERLRNSYHDYKDAKVQQAMLKFDLQPARLDAAEALANSHQDSIFFTRMVVRDLERRARLNELKYNSNRRVLVELAGEEAVSSVDLLIDLEVEEMISDLVAV
ncbi:MAG: hypothetical protein OXU45_07475 [Candidatus Melainabacteria bacterium]|nr:hypothetical protein [Candidatus Melainabacteria bacterium]